jgi:hypothetical protein
MLKTLTLHRHWVPCAEWCFIQPLCLRPATRMPYAVKSEPPSGRAHRRSTGRAERHALLRHLLRVLGFSDVALPEPVSPLTE